jgi:mono/diheme cytochrome c family protein
MKKTISRTLPLLILLELAWACDPRGSDDASTYDTTPVTGGVDFATLKARVLGPSCIGCHSVFSTASGLSPYVIAGQPDASTLYREVLSGAMPQGGPKLSDNRISLVRRYIEGLGADAPTLPPLAATWTSMKANIVERYCTTCHNAASAGDFDRASLVFDSLANVRLEAVTMLDEMQGGDMPPPESGKPGPSAEALTYFSAWINAGMPDN